jgi:hypothetical protein
MDNPPVCLSLYETELSAIERDFARKRLMVVFSWGIAMPLVVLSGIAIFFPGMLGSKITLDSVSKFSSMLPASLFFVSLNFSNKINEKELSVRKRELEYLISEFKGYEAFTEIQKKELNDDCEIIIKKIKGVK